ncbi:non-ribosomal peptide synthase/polyketide synthase [Myxococcus sp. K38C18041901]|uniref:non-ribosomal peptide synthase/polyketide synthase n=1 Tax=Myxococcus guangdongensis TaxID=2906760 RepID=UPI0020A733D8|nr:non-ribosomal peptide synthase/polyketide synthase [Myxococcus guangdongensis]MCP3059808.1 non-ribosomal peptide synthase/polyketide synthase [Myxococcus guangdongensis]
MTVTLRDGALDGRLAAFVREHGTAEETVLLAAWLATLAATRPEHADRCLVEAPGRAVWVTCPPARREAFVDLVVRVHRALRRGAAPSSPRDTSAARVRLLPLGAEVAPAVEDDATPELRIRRTEDGLALEGLGAQGAVLARSARAVLDAALREPSRDWAGLPLLDAQMLESLERVTRGEAPVEDGTDDCLTAFCAAVAATPDALALVWDEHARTYAQLDAAVRRLGYTLWQQGVLGQVVGVWVESPEDLVVVPLAVLAAGGTFAMLDARVPARRNATLLQTVRASLVVSRCARIPDDLAPEVKRLDLESVGAERPSLRGPLFAEPLLPACLSLTSGTTGTPRAAMLSRAGLLWLSRAAHRVAGGGRCALHVGSVAFDAFLYNLSLTLLRGGTLVFAGPHVDPSRLVELSRRWKVDQLCAVPSILKLLDAEALCGDRWPVVMSVGEACPPELARRFVGRARFINAYGPTETTVCSHMQVVEELEGEDARVAAGWPLPGVTGVVVDAWLRPLPPGVEGELLIGGVGVGYGYHLAPVATAERFVPDPLGPPGARAFRTGDRAVLLPDGQLWLRGRVDRQVKVRGARVDLGEVDGVLGRHPGVAEVCTAARPASAGDTRLVTYVVDRREHRRPQLERERVGRWMLAFEQALASGPSPDEEFTGWASAVTGEPMPREVMREWLDATCARILALRPRRVLEMGCGTGAILERVAPECEEYWGTDVSPVSLQTAAARARRVGAEARTRLLPRKADEGGLPEGRFDVVVVNSVVQYFPSAAYLVEVLRHAVAATRPGGAVYVGDVRHLGLHADFQRHVALSRAPGSQGLEETERQAMRAVQLEEELLVDPRFFQMLARELPTLSGVRVLARGGATPNELNQFRYDVLLHVGPPVDAPVLRSVAWEPGQDWAHGVADGQLPVRVTGIPDARLASLLASTAALAREERVGRTVADLRASELAPPPAMDPERLCAEAAARGWVAECRLRAEAPGSFDLVLSAPDVPLPAEPLVLMPVTLEQWTHEPLRAERAEALAAELARLGEAELAPWMRPSTLRVVPELPRTVSGKVNLVALASLEPASSDESAPMAPSAAGTVEALLRGIWEDLLERRLPDEDASFFALGGHSLMAVRLMARIDAALQVHLPVSALFESPTFREMAARIERLRGEGAGSWSMAVERAPRAEHYPMSTAQARVWFLEQLLPGTSTYHIPIALRLRGVLDVAALRRALHALVERHEPLRARFGPVDGHPAQWFDARRPVELPLLPFEEMSSEELEEWIRAFSRRPFSLAEGPCVRAALLRLGEREHVLVVVFHHLVADGWSMRVLTDDLTALYGAAASGGPSPLRPLELEYRDYAVAQQRWVDSAGMRAQLEEWLEDLRGQQPVETLARGPRPARRTGAGDVVLSQLSAPLVEKLRRLARAQDCTLFMVLLGGFAALVARHSRDSDLTVGTPVSNRVDPRLDALVGFFTNTLAIRTQVDVTRSGAELLRRIREASVRAFDRQAVPFDRIVERLRPVRDLSTTPIFQLWFAFLELQLMESEHQGLRLESLPVRTSAAEFDLSLSITLEGERLCCSFSYATDLFEQEEVEALSRRYALLLEGLAEDVSVPVAALPLLSHAEQRALVALGSGGAAGRYESVDRRLAAHARARPGAVAIIESGTHWDYARVDARADAIAKALRGAVGVGGRVGILMGPSASTVVTVLGALRAGVAFVLLDPSYPMERHRFMVEDAGLGLVVGDVEDARERVGAGVAMLSVDALVARPGEERSSTEPLPDELPAYLCYTSGSTGRPKGVIVPRGALTQLLGAMASRVGASASTRMLANTALSFDIALLELLLPPFVGGSVVVWERGAHLDGERLSALLRDEQVNLVQGTPSTWRLLLAAGFEGSEDLTLLCGGEALEGELARTLRRHCGRLFNVYGPTETTIWSTYHEAEGLGVQREPIGRPLPGTRCKVLDSTLRPVPPGALGELFIGGVSVAHGYTGRPMETAARFVPDPEGPAGARMYATGDLARMGAEGTLSFHGREDAQVKVRGHRIELAEVEAALKQVTGARDVVAVVREDVPGDKRLVGYVVADTPLDVVEVKRGVKTKLPEYMVPSLLVALEDLPLTPNAKVDRKALPAPESLQVTESVSYVAPRTPTEQLLSGLWESLLGQRRVGIRDDFFQLGGHSLLATQVASRIHATFGVTVALRQLFESATVESLAVLVESALQGLDAGAPPPLRVAARGGSLPLSYSQQRLWFLEQLQPGLDAYTLPAAVRIQGPLSVDVLERSFSELVRRHEALRTTFRGGAERPEQVIAEAGEVRVVREDVSGEEDKEGAVRRWLEVEASKPFDMERGPLLRAGLLKVREEEHVLVLVMHHIVSDGWSMGVLVREMGALYGAYAKGQPSPLPELPVQYADYAVWQREWLRDDALERQLGYWRQQLEGAPRVLELPTDKPRPATRSHRGGFVRARWETGLWRKVEALGRREGATAFMVLLAAYQTVLGRYARQEEVSVGAPIAGRTRTETEGLIGFFVNTLVLRGRVGREESFGGLVRQLRETTLGAYAHQDVPFEKLVEELQPERDMSRSPLFQVTLTLQNTPTVELTHEGVTLRGLDVEGTTSKYDLSLVVEEVEGGVEVVANYDSDLFERRTVEVLVGQVREVLAEGVARPEKRLWELRMQGEEERRRVVEEWSGRRTEYPRETSLAELFEEVVRRSPGAVAVEYEGKELTYEEVNGRANQLAHHLRGMGVGPEVRVGLCVERSEELVVGLLGILKAGGAYVPLDASYPLERLGWMKREAGVGVLVAQERLADEVAEGGEAVVCVDTEWGEIEKRPRSNVGKVVGGGNLAYVMFTSGSTGRPKGVGVSQRAVSRLVLGTSYASFGPEEVWLQLAPLSFDASTLEVWGALLHGGKLVVAKAGTPSLEELGEKVVESGVTSLWLTAALFEQMQGRQGEALGKVRQVLAGGDVLAVGRVRQRLEGGGVLINGYGPTENTTFTACHRMKREEEAGGVTVPIGRPIENTKVYVLDEGMEVVGEGVPGELYVGGEGLAEGYVGRADLTAERFVPSPFGRGERLYRTGDEVRWREGGVLEFLGRRDRQVKVRGYRIELGEVEAALAGHASVSEAVVVVREDIPGDKRLVAYVVPTSSDVAPLDSSAVKTFLRTRLPEYMVPSSLVVLDALPLTPNGKVDRAALPLPDASGATVERFVAPRDATERSLAALFAEVLNVERVGLHDDFFELGGHSLLATQLVSRVRTAFALDLPLRDVFEAPTVEALARKLEGTRAEPGGPTAVPPVVPVPRTDALPLSFAQQRLWFLDQLEPGSAFYNIATGVKLFGSLDVSALERAFTELVHRHESLRTTFRAEGGAPVQVIAPESHWRLEQVDLGTLSREERVLEVARRAEAEALRPFDLMRGPLLRTLLLRTSEQEHELVLVMHHIVSDGWSIGVLVREVGALYDAFARGLPSPLLPLPVQYADHAVWQRGWLRDDVLERQLAYWRARLAGASPALELPTDRPRPAVQTFRGGSRSLRWSRSLRDSVRALAQRESATPFMVLLAAFQTLLAKYSGQDDLCVGSPIANRTREETEGLIGFFVNTLVLRATLSPALSFRELVHQVRETTLGAYAHQDVPFEKLVEELQPARDLGRPPLFQVMLVLQNAPTTALSAAGLRLEPTRAEGKTAKFDLTLEVTDTDDGFTGSLEFNSDLFDASTIDRMLGHLGALLESAVHAPERRWVDLEWMTPEERRQVVSEWNQTDRPRSKEARLHHGFEAQARRTPDAVAVVAEQTQLTYRELERRANQLAWHLRARGVGPESRVAVCAERSLELVVSLLGVLKAGAAYVPLDPSYPRERLEYMLEDAAPTVLLTQQHLLPSLPGRVPTRVCLDADAEALRRERTETPPVEVEGDGLAYIIYTSGSTGRPKGAMNTHSAICNRLAWMQEAYGLTAEDRVLQKTPFSFDVSVWEFFWPLMTGARLVMARPGGHREPAYLVDLVAREGVTTLHFVPSMLRPFLEEPRLKDCTRLSRVLCSGEALTPELRDFFHSRLGAELHNLYGPTEAAVDVTAWACARDDQGARVPIGRPIANTRMYVLDEGLHPVPAGVPGELYIGGVQLARGYWRRPELTAERFVADPYSPVPGGRLYRTGDRARWLADGALEYLGRRDGQVKLRGFRIELGEVESVLRGQAGVREAVALVREDAPGDARLVAYVTAVPGATLEPSELRARLPRVLPEYMVPSALVLLDVLPLSPNGKVDRKALPAPLPREGDGAAPARVMARTPTEELLAGIWAEVLNLEEVGIHEDFFGLGGHSLLATRVLSRIRGAFGVELPLRRLFESPTVAKLGVELEDAARSDAPRAPPLRQRAERMSAPPLSFGQQRLWFLAQLSPEDSAYNLPAAVRLSGGLDVDALLSSLTELVRRHEALRTTFREGVEGPEQVIAEAGEVQVLREDVSGEEDKEGAVRRWLEVEASKPFDVERGPLLRAGLLKVKEEEHVLVLVMHHIVSDGWSMGVLVREMGALYGAYVKGQPSPLPELPVQYADFAVWQRGWLSGEELARQLGYWRQQLEGAPRVLELPTDKPRPATRSHRGGFVRARWETGLWRKVEELGRREGATAFMVLLAAYQTVLGRYARQEEVSVGAPIAGRTRTETEGLIGFFVNTLVLRGRVGRAESFGGLVRQLRETTLGAYAHQDVPFEKLVEELQPERDMSRSPLFQVTLTLQNTPTVELTHEGVTLRGLDVEGTTSKYDLSLVVEEVEGGVEVVANYDSDLFERRTVEVLVGQVREVLAEGVERPEKRLWELRMQGEEERRRVVEEWSGRRTEYPREESLAELFEEVVRRRPGAVAVEYEGKELTYEEVNGRANQLAHHLRGMGVGPEVRVGLCVERSEELVVGLLGILKAGGAYVPLDASYPLERLGWMKREAGVGVLVAQERLADEVAEGGEAVVCVDTEWGEIGKRPRSNVGKVVGGGNLAYVMFTSGSTGRPKGVGVSQRAVSRLVLGTSYASFGPEEVWLQLAPLSFDASTLEVWGALLHGGKLVVAKAGMPSLEELGEKVVESGVTSLWLTAALFEQMQGRQGEALGKVRQVLAGGDVLPVGRVRQRLEGGGVLINGYGPTENTTFTACHRMKREEEAGGVTVPIGRPIENTKVYVLDEGMEVVGEGVPGELYVGGEGLAEGYVGRADLTAERFVPSPFGRGERLYRTGDEVRWREGGVLEFLGRRDRQVKVRGYRIELGEVEAALAGHASVSEAVVVVREDIPGDKRLVAYVVGHPEASVDIPSLRDAARSRLPEYMVPSSLVVLDALPLTPNGKVDRAALPAPELVGLAPKTLLAPRTPTEETLLELFVEVLNIGDLGVDEDFFELGGHSLLATQLVSRVRAMFEVALPLKEVFDAPTVESLARKLESLRAEAGLTSAAPPLLPVPRTDVLPLSFAQQRLWFLDQLEPGSAFYNIATEFQLTGSLDAQALEHAFSELVRRHESLRTTFAEDARGAFQRIHPPAHRTLARVDLSALSPEARDAEVRRRAVAEARRPFDLSTGPLLRTELLTLSESQHVLLLTLHHIISDGWSMGVLVRELSALYQSFAMGAPSPLPELRLQYADYAVWQRGWLKAEALEAQLSWWRNHLAGASPVLELPTDFPRASVQGFHGASRSRRLFSPEQAESLHSLCRAEGTTLFMLLLAGLEVVLSRYSGQDDFIIGTDIANRHHGETEGLIGFFINQFALRARLEGDPSFRELLGRVKDTTLGAYAHQDLPFEELVKDLNPERSQGHNPLFQVKLVLQNQPVTEVSVPGLTLRSAGVETGTSRLDVTLAVVESAEGVGCTCEYRTGLFEAATIDRMVNHLVNVLHAAVASPEARLSSLSLLSEDERQQVLIKWSATGRQPLEALCAHELFERQVALAPDAEAVRFEGQSLTYAQLEARANQLAHHLRALGIRPEVPVALCVERSLETVIGMLGILKAGGAWVPMDASHPPERLAYILRDSAAPVLITTDALADLIPVGGEQLVLLDVEASCLAALPTSPPVTGLTPRNLAYVIYTSGSTGQPKGALLAHEGLCNTALQTGRHLRLDGGARVLQFFSAAFDASVWEVFGTLLAGATLVLAPRERLLPGAPLRTLLREESITAVSLTPSVLAQLEPDEDTPLRTLVSAGEACTPELVARWGGRARMLNAYGPTEVAVCATISEPLVPGRRVTIGRPWDNVGAFVLDASLRPVPAGVPGELCVEGVGLARGYHRQPALTAERFVPHPFSTTPGARLYRTGDRVRWLDSGELEYLGRLDLQVKLRGYRVEPGEVEAVLGQQPSVREVVVAVREDAPGDPRLVAYVVPAPEAQVDVEVLRASLAARLPSHMVPSAFVVLGSLPLTSSGKVDRKALPAPEQERQARGVDFVGPRTPTEELLADLFAQVLGVPRVGPREDFFELGGHSLLATQVAARVRAALGVELPVRVLFESPTVEKLAVWLEAERRAGEAPARPPLTPRLHSGPAPLSFAQQRLWFLEQLSPGGTVYTVPAVVRIEDTLDVSALERAFAELVRRHEALRTVFRAEEGAPVQVVLPDARSTPRLVSLEALPPSQHDAALRRLLDAEVGTPFDLERGPLLRVVLVRLSERAHVLALVMHHIVSDGWSMGVLVRELVALYEAYSSGQPSPLAELVVQPADHAVWQRGWLRDAELERQTGYWRKQLAGAPSALDLPTDRPRPAVQSPEGASLPFEPGPSLSAAIKAFAQREAVTPFMVVLTAFQVLLARYSGQDDVSVGTPVAGRTQAETEGLVGFFVNTLVLRTRLEGHPTFRALLSQVRDVTLDAYANQDVPFEKLVEELRPERSLSHAPLFQVMLTFDTTPGAGSATSRGPTLRPVELELRQSRFDLTLGLATTERGFSGNLEYSTALFDRGTMERLLSRLTMLLGGALAQPDARVRDLPWLTEAERHQLLVEWNSAPAPVGPEACLHELFEAQVARTPEAVAVTHGGRTLSYRALDLRANAVAHRLRAAGVAPETRVGLCVERSEELLVAILGILKAGGAYVPLDATHPRARLAFILEEARPRVIVGHRRALAALPESAVACLALDEGAWAREERSAAPESGVHSAQLAYVLYTSGSTGRPKGVALEHRNAVAFVRWAGGSFTREQLAGVLASTSVTFDLSIFELFAPLSVGGTVVMARNALELPTLPEAERVTLVNTVPSAMAELVLARGVPASVTTVNLAGEPLRNALVQALHEAAPGVRQVLNLYGPTEDTTYSTFALAPRDSRVEPTIGRPLAGTRAYVLDEGMRPVPVGVTGELYLGGVGQARGYFERPSLTAERFVPDPFGVEPGARLYRTGDRVRYAPDGALLYLGRTDEQVKVRGFRIEPGEAEATLREHPQVRDARVVAREDGASGKRLVAYIVAREGGALESAGLRDHCRERLPDFLVPSAFVVLPALPLTPNGKLDRRALPAPEAVSADTSTPLVAPRDALEWQLARLFESLLGRRVGVTTGFFEAGGHSLLAMRLVSMIRKQLGRELPLVSVFQADTVESLAALLRRGPGQRSSRVTLAATGSGRPFFCVHPVSGSVLAYSELVRRWPAEVPFHAFQSAGLEGDVAPRESIQAMAEAYLEELVEAQPTGPYRLGGWSLGGLVAYEMARLLEGRGERVELLALIDAPAVEQPPPQGDSARWSVERFVEAAARLLGVPTPSLEVEEGAARAEDVLLQRVLDVGRRAGVVTMDFGLPALRAMYDVFHANLRARWAYVPGAYGGAVTLFLAEQSERALPETARDGGWSRWVGGGVEVVRLPGDHDSILLAPEVDVLARALVARLRSAGGD